MDIDKILAQGENASPEAGKGESGMTLEELRMRKTVTLIKLEMQKEKVAQKMSATVEAERDGGLLGLLGNRNGRAMTAIDYMSAAFKVSKWVFYIWKVLYNRRK